MEEFQSYLQENILRCWKKLNLLGRCLQKCELAYFSWIYPPLSETYTCLMVQHMIRLL